MTNIFGVVIEKRNVYQAMEKRLSNFELQIREESETDYEIPSKVFKNVIHILYRDKFKNI